VEGVREVVQKIVSLHVVACGRGALNSAGSTLRTPSPAHWKPVDRKEKQIIMMRGKEEENLEDGRGGGAGRWWWCC
jgi:hypothetical protein